MGKKDAALILAFICFLFGFCGFFLAISRSAYTGQYAFYKAKPINQRNGIAVDTAGRIYIGDGEGSNIQVFDNNGIFLYGFQINTGSGWFNFGIDKDAIIHVVTARTDNYFQYSNGNLIYTEKINYERQMELEKTYNMSTGSAFKAGDKKYQLTICHNLKIVDLSNNTKKSIFIHVPVWPFPIFIYWVIGAIGVGLFFWGIGWELIKKMNRRKIS